MTAVKIRPATDNQSSGITKRSRIDPKCDQHLRLSLSPSLVQRQTTISQQHTPTTEHGTPPPTKERTVERPPSAIDLSKELSKLSLVGHAKSSITQDDAMETLENLQAWAITQDPDYLLAFHRYGGIHQLMDYLANKPGDMESVTMVSVVILESVYFFDEVDEENRSTSKNTKAVASDIAKSFVQRNGHVTLIESCDQFNWQSQGVDGMDAVDTIWNALSAVLLHQEAMLSMPIEHVWGVLIHATTKMEQLVPFVTNERFSSVTQSLFSIMTSTLNHPGVTVKEFKARNLLDKPLLIVKTLDGNWPHFQGLAEDVLSFFGTCADKKIISTSAQYRPLLCLCLECLKVFPTNIVIRKRVLGLLHNACTKIALSVLLKFEVDVAVAGILHSCPIDVQTKQEARDVMQALYSS